MRWQPYGLGRILYYSSSYLCLKEKIPYTHWGINFILILVPVGYWYIHTRICDPHVGILRDPYKIPITTKSVLHYIIRKSFRNTWIHNHWSTNAAKSESIGNQWLHGSSSTRTSLFFNRTFITLQIGRRETICDGSVY